MVARVAEIKGSKDSSGGRNQISEGNEFGGSTPKMPERPVPPLLILLPAPPISAPVRLNYKNYFSVTRPRSGSQVTSGRRMYTRVRLLLIRWLLACQCLSPGPLALPAGARESQEAHGGTGRRDPQPRQAASLGITRRPHGNPLSFPYLLTLRPPHPSLSLPRHLPRGHSDGAGLGTWQHQ